MNPFQSAGFGKGGVYIKRIGLLNVQGFSMPGGRQKMLNFPV
jgi:hypothetical protein